MSHFFNLLFWILNGLRKVVVKEINCRRFSNDILKQYCKAFSGNIINVSGWEDSDKQGNYYRNYFNCIQHYTISNVDGVNGMPENLPDGIKSIYMDLEKPLPSNLNSKFDVVLSHTVLEHIYSTQQALTNLVSLSKDVIITVLPFSQSVHYTNSYSDYVRLTPLYLKKFFEDNGFHILLCTANENPYTSIYTVMIVSKHPERYHKFFKNSPIRYDIQTQPGKWGRYGLSGLNVTGE